MYTCITPKIFIIAFRKGWSLVTLRHCSTYPGLPLRVQRDVTNNTIMYLNSIKVSSLIKILFNYELKIPDMLHLLFSILT